MSRRVFVSLVAQSENLGDLVIRRNAIKHAFPQHSVVALTTGMPDAFLQAFDLEDGSEYVASPVRFQRMLLLDSLRRRSHLLIAPGPVLLSNKLPRLLKAVVLLGNSCLVRLGGGQVMSLGRSYRGAGGVAQAIERIQRRLSNVYFVRDHESRALVGARAEVRPDMAFADEAIETGESRNVIAVSLRDAGPEVVEQLRALKHVGEQQTLEMVLVTQVKFDDELHRQLAVSLGVSHVAWGNRSHSEQLQNLSRVYSRSVAVVSNRLHALILGLQAGAAAVPVNPDKHPKLVSTLDGRVPFCELSELLADPAGLLKNLTALRTDSLRAWESATAEIEDALSSAPGRPALRP